VYKTTIGRDNYFYLWLDRATLSDHNTHHKKNSVIKNCYTALFLERMERISWIDHVRNEEVLLRVNEQRNILHEI
jgi:hypothetical protein